jgi:hypothetical protein
VKHRGEKVVASNEALYLHVLNAWLAYSIVRVSKTIGQPWQLQAAKRQVQVHCIPCNFQMQMNFQIFLYVKNVDAPKPPVKMNEGGV